MGFLDYNATVVQRVEIAPGLLILRVKGDDSLAGFHAGQYTVLGLRRREPRVAGVDDDAFAGPPEEMIKRAYSIASSSRAHEYVEFYLSLVTSGELTPRLFALKVKDRLYLGPKVVGMFTLRQVPEGHHVLLAGTGTGLAPYMSMLRTELAAGGPRRYVLVHGARYSWDLGYRAELMTMARLAPNLIYIPVITRPGDDVSWSGPTGYLQDVVLSGLVEERARLALTPEQFHVFLCGNPRMIDAARERLLARGFTPDRGRQAGTLHAEEYW